MAQSASNLPQHLTFSVGGEAYALGILRVREIVAYQPVTRVPGTPSYLRGVTNLRGSVVPVVDLAVKLGLPETVAGRRSCIVVVEAQVEGEATVLGLAVDSVSEVLELPASDVFPPPTFGTRIRNDLLLGVGRAGDRFVLLPDLDRILSTDDLLAKALGEVTATEPQATESEATGPEAGGTEAGGTDAPGGTQ